MLMRQRRATEEQSTERTGADLLLDSKTMSLDEFWDAMADEVEAMSHEDLRAELASFKGHLAHQVH